uniref:AB hydrolase-1 domain-containing protein n=1 Tax=Gasterosteus aculeatus aculeatus TaxID=481459 RepID=G3PDN4_GASAC
MQLLPGHGGGRLSGCLVGHLRIPVLSFEVRQYWRIPRACAYFGTGGSRVNGTTIHSLICTRQLEIQQEAVCLKARAFLFFNLLPRSPPLSHRHTLPASQWDEAMGRGPEWYQETLGDGRPVIIYLHGNLGTRAIHHRVELVKILSAAGYHVLSLDYRGFGDSTGEPSEAGLTSDALFLFNWVKKHGRGGPVCLWGHSLGTGVATNTAVKIQEEGSAVDALILEAPFTTMGDVVVNYPLTKIYMFLPGFESLLRSIVEMNNIVFASDENVKTLTGPLLILHSEDDDIVPYHMGQKLHELSLQAKKEYNTDVQVEMISYNANLGFSHNNIYLDPNLSNVVRKFLQNLRQ